MLDFTKLWDARYLFGPNPADLTRSDAIFLWSGGALVLLAILAKILSLRQEKQSPQRFLWNRFWRHFLTIGLLVLLWSGARYENIPWIEARIVVLTLGIIAAIWLGFILKHLFTAYPVHKKNWHGEKLKRKYLP